MNKLVTLKISTSGQQTHTRTHTHTLKLILKEDKSQRDLVLIRLAKLKNFVKVVDGMWKHTVSQIIGDGIKCCKLVLEQFENIY